MMKGYLSLGVTFIVCSLVITGCFIAPKKMHLVYFLENTCIKPHKRYSYLTCHKIEVKINNDYYSIPKNFDTDLASIPRWYWFLLSPAYSAFIAPSILHDYLYSCPGHLNRRQIDEIFYYALTENGVSRFTAYKMFVGVRLFGGSHFKKRICEPSEIYTNTNEGTAPYDDSIDYE